MITSLVLIHAAESDRNLVLRQITALARNNEAISAYYELSDPEHGYVAAVAVHAANEAALKEFEQFLTLLVGIDKVAPLIVQDAHTIFRESTRVQLWGEDTSGR